MIKEDPIYTKSTVCSNCFVEIWEDTKGNYSVGWYKSPETKKLNDLPDKYRPSGEHYEKN